MFFVDALQEIGNASGWPSQPVRPFFKVKQAPKSIPLISMIFDVKNAKCFCGRWSRPCLYIRLAIMDCPGHLEGKTSPEASIRLISIIFVRYSTPFFG